MVLSAATPFGNQNQWWGLRDELTSLRCGCWESRRLLDLWTWWSVEQLGQPAADGPDREGCHEDRTERPANGLWEEPSGVDTGRRGW